MEPNNEASEKVTPINPIQYKRLPDDRFVESYANNVFLEPNAWDLKVIFGNIDTDKGPNTVVQHTAVTLPWSQIKVGIYFLQFHLAAHEFMNGKVAVPKGIVTPPPLPTEDQEKDPRVKKLFEYLQEHFKKFSELNPEGF